MRICFKTKIEKGGPTIRSRLYLSGFLVLILVITGGERWAKEKETPKEIKIGGTIAVSGFHWIDFGPLGKAYEEETAGLSLIAGLRRILNLSHGALFLFGGYVGIFRIKIEGNFPLAAFVVIAMFVPGDCTSP